MRRQRAKVPSKIALRPGCVHAAEMPVPTGGLAAGRQRISRLHVGKASETKEAVLAAVDPGCDFGQRQGFDAHAGEAAHCVPNVARQTLALLG